MTLYIFKFVPLNFRFIFSIIRKCTSQASKFISLLAEIFIVRFLYFLLFVFKSNYLCILHIFYIHIFSSSLTSLSSITFIFLLCLVTTAMPSVYATVLYPLVLSVPLFSMLCSICSKAKINSVVDNMIMCLLALLLSLLQICWFLHFCLFCISCCFHCYCC